jgi:hypothetical protein
MPFISNLSISMLFISGNLHVPNNEYIHMGRRVAQHEFGASVVGVCFD